MIMFFRATKIALLSACLFITSFMSISVQKNSQIHSTNLPLHITSINLPLNLASISISFNEANADSIDCGELGSDACKAVKKQYSECTDNAGSDQEKKNQCKTDANKDISNAEDAYSSIDEDMADYENMTSVSVNSMKQVFISLLVEFISAGFSIWAMINAGAVNVTSLIHALMGIFMFAWFIIKKVVSDKAINEELQKYCKQQGIENNDDCKKGGIKGANKVLEESQYAGKLKVQQTDNADAGLAQTDVIDLQYAIIEQEKLYMDGVQQIANIGGGMMAAAAVVAIVESIIGVFIPKKFKKIYTILIKNSSFFSLLKSIIPSAQAEESESEYTSKNVNGNAGSWLSTSVGALASGFLGASAAGVGEIAKIVGKSFGDSVLKKVPWVKIALFAISSINLYFISNRLKKNSQGYQDRLTALNELKSGVNVSFGESSATFESGTSGAEYQDTRSLENMDGNSNEYTAQGCVDGKLETLEVTPDVDCQTPKRATLKMPSVQVGDMKGIETNGLSTDPMEYASAIVDSANGKGMASMKKTGAMNAAIGKKVLRNLLNKIKNNPSSFGATKGDVNREIEKIKAQRKAMVDQIANALPKSSFAAVTKGVKDKEEKGENKKLLGNFKSDFEMPEFNDPKLDMDEEVLGESEDDDISSADALSKVQFDQNDIVKKPEVSIWKILNLRYKKSGWKRVFKRKKKD